MVTPLVGRVGILETTIKVALLLIFHRLQQEILTGETVAYYNFRTASSLTKKPAHYFQIILTLCESLVSYLYPQFINAPSEVQAQKSGL